MYNLLLSLGVGNKKEQKLGENKQLQAIII